MSDFDLQSVLEQIMGNDELPDTKPGDKIMTAPAPVTTIVTKTEPVAVPAPEAPCVSSRVNDEDNAVQEHDNTTLKVSALSFPVFTDETIADTLDMRNYATLCRLKVRKWVGRKRDKNAARRSEQDVGAVTGSFSTYKKLFAGTEDKLRAVNSVLDAARTRHYQMTLPWSTTSLEDAGRRDGPRLLANTLFMEYISEMGAAKQAMESVLNEFETAYPSLLLEAKRNLKGAFDITQYPPSSSIRELFALDFEFSPIPEGGDYKGLPQAQIAKLREKLDKARQQCMENAMRDVWDRMHKVVKHMFETLSDQKKGFHDTLVSNVREMAALLQHLNATKDPRIEDLRTKIEGNLCRYEPDVLRKDVTKRALVAKLAGEVLQDMHSK